MTEPEHTPPIINQPGDNRDASNELIVAPFNATTDNATGVADAAARGPVQPAVSVGRLCLLLLNVLLLVAFVTLTALNGFAPAQVHGARSIAPTATASASAPTRSGAESNSDRSPHATPVQTAAASATADRTATHAPSTPSAIPPTAAPSPTVVPSPSASPTPSPTACMVTCA